MPRIIGYKFVVEGESVFPFDMLRYDACHPHDGKAVEGLSEGYLVRGVAGRRKVELFSTVKPPTIDRWRSFGWTVSDVEVVR